MQLDSFRELYASKTDGELLLLATDKGSLLESARVDLEDELRLRNFDDLPLPEPAPPAEVNSQSDHRRWVRPASSGLDCSFLIRSWSTNVPGVYRTR